jgi:hypothetical protein
MVENNMPYLTHTSDNLARVVSLFLFQPNLGSFNSLTLSFPSNAAEIPAVIAQSQTPSSRPSHHTPAKKHSSDRQRERRNSLGHLFPSPETRALFLLGRARLGSPEERKPDVACQAEHSKKIPKHGFLHKKGTLHTLSQKPNR